MEPLLELLRQIQELAGVGIEALSEAAGGGPAPEGAASPAPEGPPAGPPEA